MATQDPRLIRLVASRYPQMQGLRTMADAFWPLFYAAGLYFRPGRRVGLAHVDVRRRHDCLLLAAIYADSAWDQRLLFESVRPDR